jgi:hypothetical protein
MPKVTVNQGGAKPVANVPPVQEKAKKAEKKKK